MRFSLILAIVVLAACQPVPKPFSNSGAPPSDLLQLADGQGISVLPVTDRAGEPLKLLTTEMVQALHGQNVPATYGDNGRTSYLLLGHFSTPPAPPALIWTLQTQQGDAVGTVVQSLRNAAGEPTDLSTHNAFIRTATEIAALIQDDPPSEAVPPSIHIGDVAGAPGDGNTRLRAAIEQFLPRTGLKIVPEASDDTLIVTGAVSLGEVRGGEQLVDIAWTVWDPFGIEVGTIAQAAPVQAGSLDTNWGLVANEAALAGAVGIAEMIRQIDWSQGIQPPAG